MSLLDLAGRLYRAELLSPSASSLPDQFRQSDRERKEEANGHSWGCSILRHSGKKVTENRIAVVASLSPALLPQSVFTVTTCAGLHSHNCWDKNSSFCQCLKYLQIILYIIQDKNRHKNIYFSMWLFCIRLCVLTSFEQCLINIKALHIMWSVFSMRYGISSRQFQYIVYLLLFQRASTSEISRMNNMKYN